MDPKDSIIMRLTCITNKMYVIIAFFRETKIVLKGENAAQLTELAKQAEAKGLPNYLVQDAGRTQVAQITITKTCPCNIQRSYLKIKLKISLEKFDIFLIFAENIDCGYTLEQPR